ncbi:unnamed protein product [Ambrosiozyma monospora]|uniref:Unnamed protein product n=1 Tax=Ambrosiozyma monospora TaxID=43982 RepID=A0ACB5T8G7_AMBMO|nr:unnamed protein product [Ambrosiozyma monospora]
MLSRSQLLLQRTTTRSVIRSIHSSVPSKVGILSTTSRFTNNTPSLTTSITSKRYISQTESKKTIAAIEKQPTPPATPTNTSSTKQSNYLDTLTTSELLGYSVIGLATLNKPILDLVIKLFPFTPLWVIKKLIYQFYCGGDNLEQVKQTSDRLAKRGISNMMLSFSVEACGGNKLSMSIPEIVDWNVKSITDCLVPQTIKRIEEVGLEKINDVAPGYVALKPTGLVDDAANVLLNYDKPEYAEQYQVLLNHCRRNVQAVADANERLHAQYPGRLSPFVVAVVDAERNDLQQGVYKLQRDLFAEFNKQEVNLKVVTNSVGNW